MDSNLAFELVGYLGSALVIASIMQKSIFKLRSIGLVGSIAFFAYGVLIGAPPIAAVNLVAGSIHAYYLTRLIRRPAEVFNVLRVSPGSKLMAHFLEFHADDIAAGLQPDFVYEESEDQITSFILRDVVPAGLFIGRRHPDNSVEILLDYVVPQYRDFKIGSFLYSKQAGLFFNPNLTQLWVRTADEEFIGYLGRMGFTFDSARDRYSLEIPEIVRSR